MTMMVMAALQENNINSQIQSVVLIYIFLSPNTVYSFPLLFKNNKVQMKYDIELRKTWVTWPNH